MGSRAAAQRLIERGAVRWLGPRGWTVPRKAGDELPEGCECEITDDAELRWVSPVSYTHLTLPTNREV